MFLDNGGTVPSVKITPGGDRVGESMAFLDVPGVLDCPANDKGWVRLNSNIRNKAVHNLLTTTATGRRCSPSRHSRPTCFGSARLAPMAISQPRCR
jgi:hypothetical protein